MIKTKAGGSAPVNTPIHGDSALLSGTPGTVFQAAMLVGESPAYPAFDLFVDPGVKAIHGQPRSLISSGLLVTTTGY